MNENEFKELILCGAMELCCLVRSYIRTASNKDSSLKDTVFAAYNMQEVAVILEKLIWKIPNRKFKTDPDFLEKARKYLDKPKEMKNE